MQTHQCPVCGAPLRISNRFVKVVTCDFCQQALLLNNGLLDLTGKSAQLAELPSRFFIDAEGHLRGQPFRVLGRLRYQYAAGYWDEWFLWLQNRTPAWLVEDEGTFKLLQKAALPAALPNFERVLVGQTLPIGTLSVFITEKRQATIAGGEGQLGFQFLPGEQIYYLDGVADREQVCLEWTSTKIEFLSGVTVAEDEIEIVDEEI